MLTPEESARAKAEIELAQFFADMGNQADPYYWNDLDISEEDVERMNAFAQESPEQATSYYFLRWPRWLTAAKCYAETVIQGLADTYLRADAASAVEAVSIFKSRCDELTKYLWEEHFQGHASHWNQFHRQRWQFKLPDYAVPEIDFDRFEIGMAVMTESDPYRPDDLTEDLIERFWEDRIRLADGEKTLTILPPVPATPGSLYSGKRMSSTVSSKAAARKMEAHIEKKGIAPSAFAGLAGTTDRTLRSFRRSGMVRRDILDGIAKAMGTTVDDLIRE